MIRTGWLIACSSLIWLGGIAPGYADVSVTALRACRALTDPAARLACFDRETSALDAGMSKAAQAPPVAAAVAVGAAPAATAVAAPAANPDSPEQFGFTPQILEKQEIAAGKRPSGAPKIEARLTQLSHTANGRAIFTLDNGQVWRQLVADAANLRLRDGDTVTISRASLGSYWLAPKSGPGCKVTRLQ